MMRTSGPLSCLCFALVGCGGPKGLSGAGGDCFRADDCSTGTICVQQKCTADLTGVTMPDQRADGGGGAAATADAAGEVGPVTAGDASSVMESDSRNPPRDTGAADAKPD